MSKRPHDDLDEGQTCNESSGSPEPSSNPDAVKRRLGLDDQTRQPGCRGFSSRYLTPPPGTSEQLDPERDRVTGAVDGRREDRESLASTPPGSPRLDVGGPATNDGPSSKHLVKTLSDLPQFVTIEGYRVSSYLIDDEPYLCLPNLLQFIQQKYPLEEVIKVFENTVTSFKSATPKQVEGLIKAIALPEGAETCPLIRKFDADRVFEALADNHSDDKINLMNEESLNYHHIKKQSEKVPSERHTGNSSEENQAGRLRIGSCVRDTSGARLPTQETYQIGVAGCSKQLVQENTSIQQEMGSTGRGGDSSTRSERNYAGSFQSTRTTTTTTTTALTSEGVTSQVFDTNDDSSILDLVRASTSMLRIRVFHRCFGKCAGLYYPSRMRNSDSKCIECSVCHILLSPRRFIRHTHGPKEENVCHWGFVSSNWRYYIGLKKNQDTNDLDDEELMVQLNTLRAAPDRETKNGENLRLPAQVKNDHSNQIRIIQEKARQKLISSTPKPSPSMMVIQPSLLGTDHIHAPDLASLTRKTSAIQTNNPIGIVRPTMLDSFASDGVTMGSLLGNFARKTSIESQQDPSGLPYIQAPNSGMSRVRSGNPLEQRTLDASICPYTPHYPLSGLLANPLLFSHHFDQSTPTSSHNNSGEFIQPTHTSATNLSRLPQMEDRLIKQDIFVSSSLASYLSSRNLSGDLVRDIIERALDAVHKSRMMY